MLPYAVKKQLKSFEGVVLQKMALLNWFCKIVAANFVDEKLFIVTLPLHDCGSKILVANYLMQNVVCKIVVAELSLQELLSQNCCFTIIAARSFVAELLLPICLVQIAWCKLLGANCLVQIAWCKLIGANYLVQID
jgi:hypothetical protein